MRTNNKLTKRMQTKRRQTKRMQTKRRQPKRRQTKRRHAKGGMLRQVGAPVLTAVKSIGTEYAKDQAQKIVTGKRNVLGDITNTYKNKNPATPIMSISPTISKTTISNNKYSENDENIMMGLKPKVNVNIKPVVTLTNNKYSYSDFEI